jgi:uncharacterized membrane protein
VLAWALASQSALAASTYSVTDLGALAGATSSIGRAINDRGQVTGESGPHAFLWQNSSMTALPSPQGVSTAIGWAINSNGDVVGGGSFQPLHWRAGVLMPFGSLPGVQLTAATGINSGGTITGLTLELVGSRDRGFVQLNGTPGLLPLPAGESSSWAWAVSDSGYITGGSSSTGLRWSGPTDTPVILAPAAPGSGSMARAVNEHGDTAGATAVLVDGRNLALRATEWIGDVPHLLAALPGLDGSEARGINDARQVVGYSALELFLPNFTIIDPSMRATLWQDGQAFDLNALIPAAGGWTLLHAYDINNVGQIVGVGFNPEGNLRGFVLTPVPEPSQLVLVVVGLITLRAMSRRSKS